MPGSIYTNYRSPEIRGFLHSGISKGFARAKSDVVEVWIKPIQVLDNLTLQAKDRNRATQFTRHDPSVEILSDIYDSWILVRLFDGTIGWVKTDFVERVDGMVRPHEILLTPREFIETYLGAKYLRGGTTKNGIDCSGLSQRYFCQVRGVTIPRHSTDQWKAGTRVDDNNRQEEDLLNLRNRQNARDHVAIYFSDDKILHSCLDQGGVVIESLQNILKRYDIIGTTRI
jgi:hypothetical protein